VQDTITQHYKRDRDAADTGDDRKRVWRMYAKAVMDTYKERTIGSPLYTWRSAADDDRLPIRFLGYWCRISDEDLQELWLTLERARI